MTNQELPFVLVSNCIPVMGAKRSTICDLTRNTVKFIPNDLYTILNKHQGKSIKEIKEVYNNQYDETIDEYFRFLFDEEFIIFTETPTLFPEMSLQWHDPNIITHAIMDLGIDSKYNFYKAIKDLDTIHCKHLEIRFFRKINFEELKTIVAFIDTMQSSIVSIDFTLPYQRFFDKEKTIDFLSHHPRACSFRIYDAPNKEFIPPIDKKRGYIIYSDKILKNEKCCGVIDPSLFSINIKSFTESQEHNSCLNKKTSIDKNGNIKNCPSMIQSFGNIDHVSIEDALKHKDYKKYWNISKNQIDVCKDCELRYICTDCRAYIENPNAINSKPLKCGYDPYTNTWKAWDKNPLKEKTVKYYKLVSIK